MSSKRLTTNLFTTLSFSLAFSLPVFTHASIDTTDSDMDGMPDAWEVAYGLDAFTADDQADLDGDGLNNLGEYQAGTDPREMDSDLDSVPDGEDLFPADPTRALDSDNDGIVDSWEVIYGLSPFDPMDASLDRDGDMKSELQEYLAGTDPFKFDTDNDGVDDTIDQFPLDVRYRDDSDGDGMADKYELQFPFLDPFFPDSDQDFDGDTLTNLEEFQLGSSPDNPDSDSDGTFDDQDPAPTNPLYVFDMDGDTLPDLWEMEFGTNMSIQDVWEDPDGDGLNNLEEYRLGTRPMDPDTDRDGIPDGYEHYPLDGRYTLDMDRDAMPAEYESLNGTYDGFQQDGGEDMDGDGLSNSREFLAGTSPNNPDTDMDQVPDGEDLFPTDRTRALDSDRDGIPDAWEIIHGLNPDDAFDADQSLDGDTLTNLDEYRLGTNINKADTDGDGIPDDIDAFPLDRAYNMDSDGDGLPDAWEVNYFFLDPWFADSQLDFDEDGLSNLEEFVLGTGIDNSDTDQDGIWDGDDFDPLNNLYQMDSDQDGLPDQWEWNFGSDPYRFDSHDDRDGDRLTNLQEFLLGTNADNPDTDGDGIFDGDEHFPLDARYQLDSDRDGMPDNYEWDNGLDPWSTQDGGYDNDGDMLTNSLEFFAGTSVNNPDTDMDGVMDGEDIAPLDRTIALDTDNDGLPDAWEIINGLDPDFPYDATDDFDGDGLTVLQEYQLGTHWKKADTDGDGTADGDDLFPTNPAYAQDTDGDGMPDNYELSYSFLDPWYPLDASDDFEGDQLTNLQEFLAGTNPELPDTDNDGFLDGDDFAPTDARYQLDSDNDGLPDQWEFEHGTDTWRADSHEDADGDRLTNLEEFQLGTDANNPDTDGDGIFDGDEHFPLDARYQLDTDRDGMPNNYEWDNGLDPWYTRDGGNDNDADMLNNSQEFFAGTDLNNPDTDMDGVMDGEDIAPLDRTIALDSDNDGLPDAWEIINGFDPDFMYDAEEDFDGDGLTTLQEYQLGTSWKKADTDGDGTADSDDLYPTNPAYALDTDGDGMPDNYELAYTLLDPWYSYDAGFDDDNDELTNLQEFLAGTDPTSIDTDNDGLHDGADIAPADARYQLDSDKDGLPDNWEYDNGTDPWISDGYQDADGDRLTNLQEFQLGTDANNPDTDGDGLFDGDEHFPLDARYQLDTDRDGIPNSVEWDNGLDPWYTRDGGNDNDGDRLNNSQEFFAGTRITHPDTDMDGVLDGDDIAPLDRTIALDSDNDGLPDAWEIVNGFNPQFDFDAQLDDDADGLTLLQEYRAGTDWNAPDSDGDGVNDGADLFPTQPEYTLDSDADGLPDEYELSWWFMDRWMPDSSTDFDGDQLSNLDEFIAGTNPEAMDSDNDGIFDGEDVAPTDPAYQLDSDRDGLPDQWEFNNGTDPWMFDSHLDADSDWLSNLQEFQLFTDPNNPDTDGDGILDGDEHFPLNPLYQWDMDRDGIPGNWEMDRGFSDNDTYDALADPDGNGLTNLEEFLLTQTGDYDSDGDGMPDSFEATYGLNVTDPLDAAEDYDGDQLTNLQEYQAGTDPWAPDTDGDQLPDGYELSQGMDPTTDDGAASADEDGDGLTHLQEYNAGTDPFNPDSDGDGTLDGSDAFPLNASESVDTDGDGVGDNTDLDDDNDGLTDAREQSLGSDPLLSDTDGDGVIDGEDPALLDASLPVIWSTTGTASYDYAGRSAVALGDQDGDEISEIAIADPGAGYGEIEVYAGDGTLLSSFTAADSSIRYFGDSMALAGDLDLDGSPELIIGAPSSVASGSNTGAVLVTATDGTLLFQIDGEFSGARFGYDVSGNEDVNGDGINDFAVAMLRDDSGSRYQEARVYSGADATVLYEVSGNVSVTTPGKVALLGDLNGDGYSEFSASLRNNGLVDVNVYSGADGSMLFSVSGSSSDRFGDALAVAGDLNQDGVNDLLVGSPYNASNGTLAGAVFAYSGADGSLLYTATAVQTRWLGTRMTNIGDITGDGVPDFAASASYVFGASIRLFSGANGLELAAISSDASYTRLGQALVNLGDVDGDGQADLLLTDDYADSSSLYRNGYAGIYSFVGDSDGDGLPFLWEKSYGLDPFDPSDAALDSDGDGFSNYEEWQLGTNPLDAATTYTLDQTALSPAQVTEVNFTETVPFAYGGNQDKSNLGFVAVEDGGNRLHLDANRWQAINLSYTITSSTILELDFASDEIAEIQGIGFDTNLSISSNRTFQLAGTQNWGRRNFTYSGSGDYQHFTINVGAYFTGSYQYLDLMCDDDRNTGCDARFENIRIYEAGAPLEPYYPVASGETWESLALALYGSADAAGQLQYFLEPLYLLTAGEEILLSDLPEQLVVH